jgi:hypothetical protein
MPLKRRIASLFGKVPLRTILLVPFVVQLVGAVGLVGYLSFRNGQQAVNDVASQLHREISDRIEQNLRTLIATPHLVNETNADAFSLGQLNAQNPTGLEHHFWRQAKLFDRIALVGFVNTQREFLAAGRLDGGPRQLESQANRRVMNCELMPPIAKASLKNLSTLAKTSMHWRDPTINLPYKRVKNPGVQYFPALPEKLYILLLISPFTTKGAS